MRSATSRTRAGSVGRAVGLGLAVLLLSGTLSGCAAGANEVAIAPGSHPAGFWLGLWQGFICPITLIISWFSDRIGIYEVHNNGGWYDFGFVLGVSLFFGGSHGRSAARGRRRHDQAGSTPS